MCHYSLFKRPQFYVIGDIWIHPVLCRHLKRQFSHPVAFTVILHYRPALTLLWTVHWRGLLLFSHPRFAAGSFISCRNCTLRKW